MLINKPEILITVLAILLLPVLPSKLIAQSATEKGKTIEVISFIKYKNVKPSPRFRPDEPTYDIGVRMKVTCHEKCEGCTIGFNANVEDKDTQGSYLVDENGKKWYFRVSFPDEEMPKPVCGFIIYAYFVPREDINGNNFTMYIREGSPFFGGISTFVIRNLVPHKTIIVK